MYFCVRTFNAITISRKHSNIVHVVRGVQRQGQYTI